MVRVHAIAEPSKARTITVSHYATQILFGIFARLWTPALTCHHVVGGLQASRNLWRFLKEELDPTDTLWGELPNYGVWGVSCDLEEATDYGNISVARQILDLAIRKSEASFQGDFPLGLALLCKTMYLGKRYILYPQKGGWSMATKQKGWFMGDRLTKFVLTVAHDYVLHASGITVGSIVGDDVAILTDSEDKGLLYKDTLIATGFKPSDDDFFISKKLLFYCEEGSRVPQTLDDLPSPNLRRREQSCYQDYPRIRLLIPNASETDAYSTTNVGRFSLLGKEARWVSQNNVKLEPLFKRAVLLQHILVPQDKDTLCPFTPEQIGGDGSFINDPDFLMKVIPAKSRDPGETRYRLTSLLENHWAFRYVRSERLNEVVHKHHLMVPIIEETKNLIPLNAIIEGNTLLLNSIRVPQIERPEKTTFRLWRSYYFATLLQGKNPLEPTFNVERSFNARKDLECTPDVALFISRWRDEGFVYMDKPSYMVLKANVRTLDYMNLGWDLSYKETHDSARRQIGDAIIKNRIWNESNMESFLLHLMKDEELPQSVRDRIYRFVDPDEYIMYDVSKWEVIPPITLLISKDVKLARRLANYFAPKTVCKEVSEKLLRLNVPRFRTWWASTFGLPKAVYYHDLNSLTLGQREVRGKEIPERFWIKVQNAVWKPGSLRPIIILVEPKTYLKGLVQDVLDTLKTHDYPVEGHRIIVDAGAVNYEQFTESSAFEDEWYEYDDVPQTTSYIQLVAHPRHTGVLFANLCEEVPPPLRWDEVHSKWISRPPMEAQSPPNDL